MSVSYFLDDETVREFSEWRHAKGYAKPGASVRAIMRNYARRHGIAVAWRSDDSAIEMTRDGGGKVRQVTFPPAVVRWDWPGKTGGEAQL